MKAAPSRKHSILTTVLGILAVIMAGNAVAQTVTYDGVSGYATGIMDLVVNDDTFNVVFVGGSYDAVFGVDRPFFLNRQAAANDAADAIMNVLNAEATIPQISPGPSETLWVAYEFTPGVQFRSTQTGHDALTDPWQRYGNFSSDPGTDFSGPPFVWYFAKFTKTSFDPVPTLSNKSVIWLSVLLGLLGIARLRRYTWT